MGAAAFQRPPCEKPLPCSDGYTCRQLLPRAILVVNRFRRKRVWPQSRADTPPRRWREESKRKVTQRRRVAERSMRRTPSSPAVAWASCPQSPRGGRPCHVGDALFCREAYSPSPSRAGESLDIPRGTRGGTGCRRYVNLSACFTLSAVPLSAARK